MRKILTLVSIVMVPLLVLSACGVDAPPQRPGPVAPEQKPNVSVSGHATVGVITEL